MSNSSTDALRGTLELLRHALAGDDARVGIGVRIRQPTVAVVDVGALSADEHGRTLHGSSTCAAEQQPAEQQPCRQARRLTQPDDLFAYRDVPLTADVLPETAKEGVYSAMRVFKRTRVLAALGLLVTVSGCETPTGLPQIDADGVPRMALSHAGNGGAAGFYFLPPMIKRPGPFAGDFDATLAPVVRICRWVNDVCAGPDMVLDGNGKGAQRLKVDAKGESYGVLWKETRGLKPGDVYRLRVYTDASATVPLGYADLLVVARPNERKRVPAGFIGVARRRPFHIKFRIEKDREPAPDTAPVVTGTTPADGATGFPRNANLAITFSEAVTVEGDWFEIVCATSGTHTTAATTVTGGPTRFIIDPTAEFTPGETCAVTVVAAQVADQDANDPPENMAVDHVFEFTVSPVLAPAPVDDGPEANSTPGDPYHGHVGIGVQVLSPGLLANDVLGIPAGRLTSFGGGSLGGTAADHAAGTTVEFGEGGELTVFANGALAFIPASDFTGPFTFQYRVTNEHGSGEATVTIFIGERPPEGI